MKTKKIEAFVTEDFHDRRLDHFVATLSEISSRSYAQALIKKNQVLVDGQPSKVSTALKSQQKIEIFLPDEVVSTELIPYDFKLDIPYEDDDLLVVNKPSGLVVHPAAGHQQDTLVNALLFHTKNLSLKNEQRPGIVHRIDKETSGLLVVAKNDFSHEALSQQFKNKTAHRIYYAAVEGLVKKKSDSVQSFLSRHPTDRKRYSSVRLNNKIIHVFDPHFDQGKWAVTHYEKVATASNMSYLKLKLETGRTHQIRVHMSELGHPLVGDVAYGYSKQKHLKNSLSRFFLHAAELGFVHPRSAQSLMFKAPWPPLDIQQLIKLGFSNDLFKK